jgi:putative toxin-antitoxin system antitoxin component (TIGR02293 family)
VTLEGFWSSGASRSHRLTGLLLGQGTAALSETRLAQAVLAGLPPIAARNLMTLLGRDQVIGPIIPEATFRRAEAANRLPREHSERLFGLGLVIEAASRAWRGDTARIDAFLRRPHPLLESMSPLELARSGPAGAQAVLSLIDGLDAGVPV